MATSRVALRPETVGSRMSLVVAVLAAAVMFGVGFGAAYVVASLFGGAGGLTATTGLVAGSLAAGSSAQASVRRILRSRRSAATPA